MVQDTVDTAEQDAEACTARHGTEDGRLVRVWARHDKGARNFQITKAGGPAWPKVTKRMTVDTKTNELLEEVDITEQNRHETERWQRPLPGREEKRDLKTTFWYVSFCI